MGQLSHTLSERMMRSSPFRFPSWNVSMRLTLRTLLAYLDNTLSADDAKVLRDKLTESGFATALVTRIRQTISRGDLGSASPSAVDPVHDANVIGEYLDSTMPPEQIAEIERATLESDSQLAEMASCHQILTMVLGQTATVSDSLRHRIYHLPDASDSSSVGIGDEPSLMDPSTSHGDDISVVGDGEILTDDRFSSLQLPSSEDQPASQWDSPSTPEVDSNIHVATTVVPVGKADSGVADAPTRLRRQDTVPMESSPVRKKRPFESSERPLRLTRIMPYLVGFGTLAVLLFALAQVFRPLLDQDPDRLAENLTLPPLPRDVDDAATLAAPPGPSASLSASEGIAMTGDDRLSLDDVEMIPPPGSQALDAASMLPTPRDGGSTDPTTAIDQPIESMPAARELPSDLGVAVDAVEVQEVAPEIVAADPTMNPETPDDVVSRPPPVPTTPPSDKINATDAAVASGQPMSDAGETVGIAVDQDTVENEEVGYAAKLLPSASPTLLISRRPLDGAESDRQSGGEATSKWLTLEPEKAIAFNTPLVVAPKFRANVQMSPSLVLSVIGPAEFSLDDVDSTPLLQLGYGRCVVTSNVADAEFVVLMGAQRTACILGDSGSSAALSAIHSRSRGEKLLSVQREIQTSMLATNGSVDWVAASIDGVVPEPNALQSDDGELNMNVEEGHLDEGRGWTRRSSLIAAPANAQPSIDESDQASSNENAPPEQKASANTKGAMPSIRMISEPVVSIERAAPGWASEKRNSVAADVDELAREGLMSILDSSKSLEISLREATTFRRSEVAALAGQTLLAIGRAEVYFGVDGLLAKQSQRTYWNDHYRMLLAMVDRGPAIAGSILQDIDRMDHAGEPTIRRLLRGYSQKDLGNGGDAELVAALDSPSMPIRVLAIQNLQSITGKKLFYRAEHETEAKREAAIKTWQAWLRRGDIRWPEAS